MAKYNVKREPVVKATTTHEGGQGFTQRPEAELIGLLSSGIQNTFYEQESDREVRLRELIDQLSRKNKTFVAKALIYARSVFGQRTVTHLGSVNLMPHLSGDPLGKRFFTKRVRKENRGGIVYRLDDMTEILSCYFAKNGEDAPIPNALKKGFRDALENADAYELAKYQSKNRGVSMVDIVNLVHPRETEKNGMIEVNRDEYLKATKGTKFEVPEGQQINTVIKVPALRALVLGILKQFNTAEDKNTKAGQEVAAQVKSGELTQEEAKEVLTEKKTENYEELIRTKKIGYIALLRNLRNIINTGNGALLNDACELITNRDFISKSLVWPHQIDICMEVMLVEFSGRELQKVTRALDIAYENSIPNLEKLLPEGRTAVVFDTSGSMQGSYYGSQVHINQGTKKTVINSSPVEKAALIAATFAKGTGGDVYHFGTSCARITGFNPNDAINTLKGIFVSHTGRCGHGTLYQHILPTLAKEGGQYDRVIIITDEQGCDSFERSYNEYKNTYGTPYVYFVNICGYAPTMAKAGNKVFRIYGYSADIYEKIPQLEMNIDEVIDAINRIEI